MGLESVRGSSTDLRNAKLSTFEVPQRMATRPMVIQRLNYMHKDYVDVAARVLDKGWPCLVL